MFPGISMDPDIRFGKPCITGTRIDVATLVGAVAAGETVETVAEEYALTVEQVRSALSYAAHVACAYQIVNRSANLHLPTCDLNACVRAIRDAGRKTRTSSRRGLKGCDELRVLRRPRPSVDGGRLACSRAVRP
jgi:uncharacterized protein (DUF433 family)